MNCSMKNLLYVLIVFLLPLSGCHQKEWESKELKHDIGNGSSMYRCEENLTYPELIDEGYTSDDVSAKYVQRGRKCKEWGYVTRNGGDDFANFDGPNGGSSPGPGGYLAGVGSGPGGGGGNNCLEGTWERLVCGSTTQKATITFTNTSAVFNDWDCTRQCPRIFGFNYTKLSNSELQITYTSAEICFTSAPIPGGGVQGFSCDGNTLNFGNTYTRRQ